MRFSTLFYFFPKLYLGPYDQAKTVREIFVFAKVFTKNMCRVVVDYSGTVSTTLRTPCQRSRLTWRESVSGVVIVVD